MATEAVVSFALERFGDMLIQEAIFLKGVRRKVERLNKDLGAMKCFLEEAEKKQEEDLRVRKWVSEIRDAVYDVEDIIDMFILNVESLRTDYFLKRVFKKLINRHKVGKKIEDIQLTLQDISNRREALGIKNIGEVTSGSGRMLQDLRRSSPRAEERVIVGLTEEADKLVKQLTVGDQRRRVISLVGMGGIGKTTLAKKVYNHEKIVEHFPDCRAWIYVSQDCRPREVYMQIINQVSAPTKEQAEMIEKYGENELGDFLHDHLKEKRYLIVLDDVWKCAHWNILAKVSSNDPDCPGNVFPDGSNGSRLLLTTRYKDVALHADARTIPHEMRLLSKQQSWDLFCRKAFLDADTESYPPDLKELGEEMVDKCNGLPLAIVVLGGLLSRSMSRTEWKQVHDNIQAYLAKEGQMGVMAMLNLSYIDLPHYLKPCFLHLSLFPEDYVISSRKLLLLWTAEGFVPEQDDRRMKDMAEAMASAPTLCITATNLLILLIFFLPSLVLSDCSCDEAEHSDHPSNGGESLKYKLAAIASILVAGAAGVSIPLLGKKVPALNPENHIFFMIKAFAAGVILATGFIHILPEAFERLTSPCLGENPWGKFPFTGLVAMMSAIGTLMVDTFATGYYKRQHFSKPKQVTADEERGQEHAGHVHVHTHATHGHAHGSASPSDEESLSDLIRRRIVSQVLELGIVVHSVIIGVSLGASQRPETIKPLLAALSFHQFFEGLGLGGCISQAKFRFSTMAMMVLFFSLTTPVGIVLGIGISRIYHENGPTALIVEGVFDAASAGILIYMALVDLLAADFMNPRLQSSLRLQLGANISLLLGTGCMSFLAKWA